MTPELKEVEGTMIHLNNSNSTDIPPFKKITKEDCIKEFIRAVKSENNFDNLYTDPSIFILSYADWRSKAISRLIKMNRLKKKMTLNQLAKMSGHAVTTIRNIESGKHMNFAFKTAYDISRILRISLKDFAHAIFFKRYRTRWLMPRVLFCQEGNTMEPVEKLTRQENTIENF